MQATRATRRVSVAKVLGVGRIGCAAGEEQGREHEGIRAGGEKRLGRILWRAVAGEKHVT